MQTHTGPHVIVIGNEKGGTGKSTAAMHVAVGLMKSGRTVAVTDLDVRQGTLKRFLANRETYAHDGGHRLPIPTFLDVAMGGDPDTALDDLTRSAKDAEVLVMDTPGSATPLSEAAHARADTLITPMNDSFIDLDVLARVQAASLTVERPSHYAEMVFQHKIARAGRDRGAIDWIVMLNRQGNLDSHNRRQVSRILEDLAKRVGFRIVPGFGERVIYRELFPAGLTIMDLKENADGLTMSQVAARQEVRRLVEEIRLPAIQARQAS